MTSFRAFVQSLREQDTSTYQKLTGEYASTTDAYFCHKYHTYKSECVAIFGRKQKRDYSFLLMLKEEYQRMHLRDFCYAYGVRPLRVYEWLGQK
jgi:hypothetical protein